LVIGEGAFLRTDGHHEPFSRKEETALLDGSSIHDFATSPED
jgi:hypothetical protein